MSINKVLFNMEGHAAQGRNADWENNTILLCLIPDLCTVPKTVPHLCLLHQSD